MSRQPRVQRPESRVQSPEVTGNVFAPHSALRTPRSPLATRHSARTGVVRTTVVIGLLLILAVVLVAALFLSVRELVAADAKTGDGWQVVSVPDSWKKLPTGVGEGYSWYRCYVKIPASWKGKNLELFVEPVDDARATYFNGVQVGMAGTMPPQYRSGLGEKGRFTVDKSLVKFGEYNVVAVRTFYQDGRTNFQVAAPAVLQGKEAIKMEGAWEFRAGDDLTWANRPEDLKPVGDALYEKVDQVEDVESYIRRRQGDNDPFPPSEAVKQFTIPDDLELELVLSEPEITQPLFLNFDERGRLWVLEYRQYPDVAGVKMVSRDKYLRSVYDKVPLPPPFGEKGRDRISIHEDSDGDGRYDRHSVFVDGLNIATSFERGRGGVWVLNPPYLLFYPDRNNDDVPDADPEVHLEGFGLEDSHSVVNSLRWGPDGWLYGAQGSTVTGHVKRYGTIDEPVHSMGQLIWRYHPEDRKYEIFAEGGGNTFGVELDAKGRIYSGHNGGDTRGFHYVQGGYFRKGFGKHGELSNPFAFGFFDHMQHHSVPRFTHNFIIYEADNLPEEYRGRLFGVEPLQGQIVMSDVSPDGSTYRTKDLSRPVTTDDQWFRPVDIKLGPDGAIYICDLYEQRIDHSSHYAGRIDRTNGRVYRLKGKGAPAVKPFDLAALSSRELLDVLGYSNRWQRQSALRVLSDRRDRSIIPDVNGLIDGQSGQLALEGTWALSLGGGFTDARAMKLLDHDDPFVRLWTVRLLCDSRRVTSAVARRLAELAKNEPYVQTRSQLACSAKRLPAAQALPIIASLLAHDEDAGDVHLPLLVWWALESHADRDREAILTMLADRSIWERPLFAQHITERLMKRYAITGSRKDLLTCARLLELAPGEEQVKKLMAGFEEAYKGRSLATLPEELARTIAKVGGGSPALRLRQGDPEALAVALKEVKDEKADRDQRLQFVRIFGEVSRPESVPVLLQLAESSKDDELRSAALTALGQYRDPQIASAVIAFYGNLDGDVLPVAQTLLASRREWSHEFLTAIDEGRVKADSVSDSIVRKLLLHPDEQLLALVRKIWGDVQGATTAEMRQQIETLAKVIAAGTGNPYKGKQLYMKNCGKCHTLFAEGGQVGPDLTSFKRDDLGRMLVNVVNPSAEIREGFENYVVLTADGRVLNGFLADQDSQVVVLRGVDGQNQIIPRDDIDEMRAIPRSVMPDGALKDFSEQDVRDLFAYLRATQPLR